MAIITAPDHLLAYKKTVTVQDMNNQSFILTEPGCSYRRIFESILTQAGVTPASVIAFSSNDVIKKFVMDGWGIGFLPRIAVEQEYKEGRLAILPWIGPPFQIKTQIIYHKDKWLSPALRAFIDVTTETFKHANKKSKA